MVVELAPLTGRLDAYPVHVDGGIFHQRSYRNDLQSMLLFGGLWLLFVVAYAAALIAYRVANWDVWVAAAAIIVGGVGIAGAVLTLP